MTNIPDDWFEQLAAYLDGELDGNAAAAFEARCAADPLLAEQLARVRGNDELLRGAFEPALAGEVDDALLARMGLAPAAGGRLPANDDSPAWGRWRWPIGGALAASLALVVIFSGAPADQGFSGALDRTPSGQLASLDDGSSLRPVLTFQAADGRYCREYALEKEDQAGSGIACRNGERWQVEAVGQGTPSIGDPGRIVVAGDEGGTDLDSIYAQLGASDPLGGDVEAQLIANRWMN